MSRCKGPFKSMFLQLFTGTNMEGDNPEYNLDSSDWHVRYREPVREFNAIRTAAIDLCKNDITHELFGLTYKDLMDMDYPTFSHFKKVIQDMARQKHEAVKSMKSELEDKTKKG